MIRQGFSATNISLSDIPWPLFTKAQMSSSCSWNSSTSFPPGPQSPSQGQYTLGSTRIVELGAFGLSSTAFSSLVWFSMTSAS